MLSKTSQMPNVFQGLKMQVIHTLMNEYEKFCIDEAQSHLNKAHELLTDGLRDPKKYHDEAKDFYRIMAKVFPLMVLLQHTESQLLDPEMEESLSDTLSSDQSDSDNFVPATPLHHSDS